VAIGREEQLRASAIRASRAGQAGGARRVPAPGPWRHSAAMAGLAAGVWVLALALVLFLALPLGALVERTSEQADAFDAATRTTLRQALALSLTTSTVALGLTVAFGTPLAYLLARCRFPGARLVDALVDLPIVLPPAVAGLALLMAFGRRGVVGARLDEWGLSLAFSTEAVVLAQVFVAAPFYVRAAKAGFARVDRDLERAAAGLGAAPPRVFWRVTLPLVRPSLAAGAVLAWARALGEFGATIMFAGNFAGRTQTRPPAGGRPRRRLAPHPPPRPRPRQPQRRRRPRRRRPVLRTED
jgi:molybdate transport system permease protein